MLSWSGSEQGVEVDLSSVQASTGGVAVPFARELLDFATAAAELDETVLVEKRNALLKVAGVAATIDAADSTGARMPTEVVAERLGVATAMGVDQAVSRR
jgi:hypothetical protein